MMTYSLLTFKRGAYYMAALIKLIIDNGIGIVCVAVVVYDHLVN